MDMIGHDYRSRQIVESAVAGSHVVKDDAALIGGKFPLGKVEGEVIGGTRQGPVGQVTTASY